MKERLTEYILFCLIAIAGYLVLLEEANTDFKNINLYELVSVIAFIIIGSAIVAIAVIKTQKRGVQSKTNQD